MAQKVTQLALISRIIVLVLQVITNLVINDHKPDVFRAPTEMGVIQSQNNTENLIIERPIWLNQIVDFCFGGLRHWDGEYFLHVAQHSYTYEQTLAFYPLFPLLVGSGAHVLHCFGLGLTFRSCTLIAAVLLNLYCFCKATNTLYELTQRIFNDRVKSWYAALLFCYNPASIFFTAAYSESLFCWLSFELMLECVSELRFVRYTCTLACLIICRSNGLVSAGFPIYFLLRKWIVYAEYSGFCQLLKISCCMLLSIMPLSLFYFFAFQHYCIRNHTLPLTPAVVVYGKERNYVLAGNQSELYSPWCNDLLPFPYSYVQSHYWNVGFLRYYKLKQLPNFFLAFPVLTFGYSSCWKYLIGYNDLLLRGCTLKDIIRRNRSLPFVLHALFLIIFCTLFVHIQISTRLLFSASPCLYWFTADSMPRTYIQVRWRSKVGTIVIWFVSYFIVGTALFSNNFPWT